MQQELGSTQTVELERRLNANPHAPGAAGKLTELNLMNQNAGAKLRKMLLTYTPTAVLESIGHAELKEAFSTIKELQTELTESKSKLNDEVVGLKESFGTIKGLLAELAESKSKLLEESVGREKALGFIKGLQAELAESKSKSEEESIGLKGAARTIKGLQTELADAKKQLLAECAGQTQSVGTVKKLEEELAEANRNLNEKLNDESIGHAKLGKAHSTIKKLEAEVQKGTKDLASFKIKGLGEIKKLRKKLEEQKETGVSEQQEAFRTESAKNAALERQVLMKMMQNFTPQSGNASGGHGEELGEALSTIKALQAQLADSKNRVHEENDGRWAELEERLSAVSLQTEFEEYSQTPDESEEHPRMGDALGTISEVDPNEPPPAYRCRASIQF